MNQHFLCDKILKLNWSGSVIAMMLDDGDVAVAKAYESGIYVIYRGDHKIFGRKILDRNVMDARKALMEHFREIRVLKWAYLKKGDAIQILPLGPEIAPLFTKAYADPRPGQAKIFAGGGRTSPDVDICGQIGCIRVKYTSFDLDQYIPLRTIGSASSGISWHSFCVWEK